MSHIKADGSNKVSEHTPEELNAYLNVWGLNNTVQIEKDEEAAKQYHLQVVNPNFMFFYSDEERLKYLVDNDYYDIKVLDKYTKEFLLYIHEVARNFKFRFSGYVSSFKYYVMYALKTRDGLKILERPEHRSVMVSLELADGNEKKALDLLWEILNGRFQPATPIFLNAGKAQRGEPVSCFLVDVFDDMSSISKAIAAALQLSKRGGGVAINLSNLREQGAPIKKIEGLSSGPSPFAKVLDDSFRYANQLGSRTGAGAGWIHFLHPDLERILDTKKENADDLVRLRVLTIGVVIPDVVLEHAKNNEDIYQFSPYDITKEYGVPFSEIDFTKRYRELADNPKIKKYLVSPRKILQKIAEIQQESGFPYILFEDNVNRDHQNKGKIKFSNICVEVIQNHTESQMNRETGEYDVIGNDVSCVLGSVDIAKVLDGGDLEKTMRVAVESLSHVSDIANLKIVPTIDKGNSSSHAIGVGLMNLHGALARDEMKYGSEEARDFMSAFTSAFRFYALRASNNLAKEKNETYEGFEESKYASGDFFNKYVSKSWLPKTEKAKEVLSKYGIDIPTQDEWEILKQSVMEHGLYNKYLTAVAPTGSISYVRAATPSVQPIMDLVEVRKEGKLGRVYAPAPFLKEGAQEYYETAYDLGPEPLIDMMSVIQEHIDQSISTTLYFKENASTRDITKAQLYAWRKGLKTLYYTRIRKEALSGTEQQDCVSCSI